MIDPLYPLFSTFAFLGFFLALVPLPWHLQAWNAGTCAYMLWASTACLIEFVNSIVWKDNAINVAPVWCDISSKILLGAGIGIPASSLCISRRLYNIAAVQTASVSRQDKRRALIGDLCIAVGIPVLVMILHYIVQGHRFDILEEIGCYPAIFNSIPAFFLVYMWPVLLGSVSFVYSALTLYAFYKRRLQFSQIISDNSSMNTNRYLRLMLLALIEMACTVPLGIYSIYISHQGDQLRTWVSFADTHFGFSYVGQVPAVDWRSGPSFRAAVELTRWLYPICALLFFALFGFASEAKRHYHLAFWWVVKPFGLFPPAPKTSLPESPRWKFSPKLNPLASVGTLPIYTARSDNHPNIHTPSFMSSSSFAATDMPYDVEKTAGLPSPTLTLTTPTTAVHSPSIYVQTPSDDGHTHVTEHDISNMSSHISVSDAFPSSVPPSPQPQVLSEPPPVPQSNAHAPEPTKIFLHHRPFTPPSIYPVNVPFPSTRHAFGTPIHVTVHTESHEDV